MLQASASAPFRNLSASPVGVVLAGGPGHRIGGSKPSVSLHGEAMLHYPLRAMRGVLRDVAVLTKPEIVLPQIAEVMVWVEPSLPEHPLFGLSEALALAGGRPVLACPVDMPCVTSDLLVALLVARTEGGDPERVVIAAHEGAPVPLLGVYPAVTASLLANAADQRAPVSSVLELCDPLLVEVEDPMQLFDVDAPDDLLQAAAIMGARNLLRAPMT